MSVGSRTTRDRGTMPTDKIGQVCQGCGTALPPQTWQGRARIWCSDKCRKTQYAGECIDCGKKLNGSDGRGPNAAKRCVQCAGIATGAEREIWTRDQIIARMHEWAAEHGEQPAMTDWNPFKARSMNDPERAERFEAADGHWPWMASVVEKFGSWNAAIEAAGFGARDPWCPTTWTQELVVARIREWVDLYGQPPRATDWSPVAARQKGFPDRAEAFEAADNHWPWMNTVIARFGTWNAAIEAAGFAPRNQGRQTEVAA